MPVPTDDGVVRYTGTGATSTFSVPFYFQSADDLTVVVRHVTTRTKTLLARSTDYTVSGAGDPDGGTITLIGNYANLSSSYNLTITLDPDLADNATISTRTSNATLQASIDKLHQITIKLKDDVARCIKLAEDEAPTEAKTILPAASSRTSKSVSYDSSGNLTATTVTSSGSISISSFGESLVDDSTASDALTTLGVSSFAKTVLDDASASAARTTLGIDGASGVIAAGDLATNSVTTAKITDANVTAIKLANDAVAHLFQARLTLTTATPTAESNGAGTIYLTPFRGNKIALYNGTIWKLHSLTEISLALTATSGTVYDVWVYDNSGTLTLETTAWTNTTTRATALATQDGVYCKTGALTRRYVGTFYANASNQTADNDTGRFVWNYYNRVLRPMHKAFAPGTTNYTSATIQQYLAEASYKLQFVVGVKEDVITAEALVLSSNTNADVQRQAGLVLDSTTTLPEGDVTNSFTSFLLRATGAACPSGEKIPHYSKFIDDVAAGYHYISLNHSSAATGTTTWGDVDSKALQGMMGYGWF